MKQCAVTGEWMATVFENIGFAAYGSKLDEPVNIIIQC